MVGHRDAPPPSAMPLVALLWIRLKTTLLFNLQPEIHSFKIGTPGLDSNGYLMAIQSYEDQP